MLCAIYVRRTAGENGPSSMPSLSARKERARLVQAVADEFMDAFVGAAGLQAHVSIYMHIIKCHLGQFVELYGNLMDYSAQGSEHCHVLTKYAMRHQTNKKPDQRVEQALKAVAYLMHYEKLYPSTKGMGTKRKRPEDIQAEEARKEERLQEVLEIAQEMYDARPVEIEEVDEDASDDEGEEQNDDEERDEEDAAGGHVDDLMI